MNPPANWYPDPTGRHGQRYWDGEQWTEHVFTDGVQGIDPLDAAASGDQASETAVDEASSTATDETPSTAEQGTSGLFADAGDAAADPMDAATHTAEADTASDAGDAAETSDESTWAPEEHTAGSAEQEVAPEVEPEDVVSSLDEVAETEPSEDASTAATAATVAPDAVASSEGEATGDVEPPAEDAVSPAEDAATAEEDQTPPAGDFSDAFMVTPETVSRLVSRQAGTEPQEPDEMPPPTEQPAEPVQSAQPEAAAASMEAPSGGSQGAIDAPPPAVPSSDQPPTTGGTGLGISGDLVGGAFAEREEAGPVALQNSRLLRCSLGQGQEVIARQGTMVAYQGEVGFERQGAGGVTRALKRAATGEGLAMMRAEGTGDVFFADGGQHVFLLQLEGGPGLSVNGRNVLAFSAALQWDIERVKGATLLAGGLFNTSLTGTGWVALVSDGEPVVLRTDEAPTYVDVNALVAWSGGLSTRITSTVSAKSLVGLGSGEAFQMAFEGSGIVIVQPSEGPMGGAAAT